jgi:hypothetical protein
MPDPPESGHDERDKSAEPRQTQIERIVISLDRLRDEYTRANKEESTRDNHKSSRERVTAWLIGVYTIITAVIMVVAISQAVISRDSEHRQLRAYIGPVFNSFRLTTKYAECEPSDTAIAPHTIFCYHFKNYGLTPARVPHNCIVIYVGPVRGTLNETKNAELAGCAPNPTPTAPTIWPGENRLAMEETQFQEQIALIMAGNPGFLFGKMTYYDIFGDFHFTDICRQIIRRPDQMILRPCRIEGQQDN